MVQGTGRRRRDEALVVGQAQRTGPGVEELAGGGAGFQLGAEEHAGGVGGPVGQRLSRSPGRRASWCAGRRWSREGLPSTMYAARVNGAPAKPISGVLPSSATVSRTASRMGSRASRVSCGSAATSAAVRTGCVQHGSDAGHDVHVRRRPA